MKDSQRNELDMGRRTREFLDAHKSEFPDGTRAAVLRSMLISIISEIEEQAANQDAATLDRQESTAQKRAALKSIKEQLRPINRTARSLEEQSPGISDQFRMPTDADEAVLARARAFISEATPIQSEFTSRGLPDTFLTDLQSAIGAYQSADNRQAGALARQTGATAAIREALKQLLSTVRELDAIIRNRYRSDPATLAAWRSAAHIERARRRTSKADPSPKPAS